jgi:hypothetical protein
MEFAYNEERERLFWINDVYRDGNRHDIVQLSHQ